MDRKSSWLKRSISDREAGKTLVAYLQNQLQVSGRSVKRALEQGACALNGAVERFGSIRLKRGDRIAFLRTKIDSVTRTAFALPILFEDKNLLFCAKPSGLVSDQHQFSSLLQRPIFLAHRLDRETSGVMVVAKTKQVEGLLQQLFFKRQVEKIYFALVSGEVSSVKGTVRNFLAKKKSYDGQTLWGASDKGALAVTDWWRVHCQGGMSLLQCQPKTGRTHQLRVHLSDMGHPILGDFHYGRSQLAMTCHKRLCLHAYSLSFVHPITKKTLCLTAPVPHFFRMSFTPDPYP
ncbi:MAG: RluA family pseudouridine synthase [Chlamydiota bacterium]